MKPSHSTVALSVVALVAAAGLARGNSRQGSGAKSSDVELLQTLMSQLRRLDSIYRELHWRTDFYANHLLYQKLYEGVNSSIDRLGEMMVAIYGADSVRSSGITVRDNDPHRMSAIPREDVTLQSALESESFILSVLSSLNSSIGSGYDGMALQNTLQQFAEERIHAIYLLRQSMDPSSYADGVSRTKPLAARQSG
jgi:hypothetical protein